VPPTNRWIKVIALTAHGIHVRAQLVQTLAAGSPLARLSGSEQQHLYGLLAKAGAHPALFTCPATDPG
jgi:hypothetical protein